MRLALPFCGHVQRNRKEGHTPKGAATTQGSDSAKEGKSKIIISSTYRKKKVSGPSEQ